MTFSAMQPVTSSNVAEVGYDAETRTLYVQFKAGGLYAYSGVPQQKYQELITALSVGAYLHQYIKNVYPFQKIS